MQGDKGATGPIGESGSTGPRVKFYEAIFLNNKFKFYRVYQGQSVHLDQQDQKENEVSKDYKVYQAELETEVPGLVLL